MAALAACDRGEPGRVREVSSIGRVETVTPVEAPAVADFPARVRALDQAEVATRVSGTILTIDVDVGAAVAAGAILATLDGAGTESRVAVAEAEARLARRSFDRLAALERDGAATPQELDEALARKQVAEAALQRALAARSYVTLRAPFAGVVTARMADPGDLAVPGRPVLELASISAIKIQADLPVGRFGTVSPGDSVLVVDPSSGSVRPATVTAVVPALQPSALRFRVEAHLKPSAPGSFQPLPGSLVRLRLTDAGRPTRWIPVDATLRRGQLTGVFVLDGDAARLRWVRLGQRSGDAVEVLAGVRAGERVILRPPPSLADGTAVRKAEHAAWKPEFRIPSHGDSRP